MGYVMCCVVVFIATKYISPRVINAVLQCIVLIWQQQCSRVRNM